MNQNQLHAEKDIKKWKCFQCFQREEEYGEVSSNESASSQDLSILIPQAASPCQSFASSCYSEPESMDSLSDLLQENNQSSEDEANSDSHSSTGGNDSSSDTSSSDSNANLLDDDSEIQNLQVAMNRNLSGIEVRVGDNISEGEENEQEDADNLFQGEIQRGPTVEKALNFEVNLFVTVHRYHVSSVRCHSSRQYFGTGICEDCGAQCDTLWRCVDCEKCVVRGELCKECISKSHINKLHNMQCVTYVQGGNNVFFPPHHIDAVRFPNFYLVPTMSCGHKVSWERVKEVCNKNVTVVDLSGIYVCLVPSAPIACDICGHTQEVSPVVFNCLASECVRETTWVSRKMVSLCKHIRARNGDGVYGLCEGFANHWKEQGAFFSSLPTVDLIKRIRGSVERTTGNNTWRDSTEEMHQTKKGLAKKITMCLNIENQLTNSSWMDTNTVQKARHQMRSVCAMCHEKCQQLHIDGNMKMKRLETSKYSIRCARYGNDLFLSSEEIKRHMQRDLHFSNNNESSQCGDVDGLFSAYRAGSCHGRRSKSGGFAQTGMFIAVCPHHNPLLIAKMTTTGEPYYLAHAMVNWFEEQDTDVKFYSYDIACMFLTYLKNRHNALYQQVKDRIVLGYFHGLTHKCRNYNTGFTREGAGYCDGEQSERLNSLLVTYSSFLKYMKEENFIETLSDLMYMETSKNNMRCPTVILRKMERVCRKVHELCKELEVCLGDGGLSPSQAEMKYWVSVHTRAPPTFSNQSEKAGKKVEEYVSLKFEKRSISESIEDLLQQKDAMQRGNLVGAAAKARLKYLTTALQTLNRFDSVKRTVRRDSNNAFWIHNRCNHKKKLVHPFTLSVLVSLFSLKATRVFYVKIYFQFRQNLQRL